MPVQILLIMHSVRIVVCGLGVDIMACRVEVRGNPIGHALVLALGDEASYAVVLIDVTPHPPNNPIMIIVREDFRA